MVRAIDSGEALSTYDCFRMILISLDEPGSVHALYVTLLQALYAISKFKLMFKSKELLINTLSIE